MSCLHLVRGLGYNVCLFLVDLHILNIAVSFAILVFTGIMANRECKMENRKDGTIT